jgi:hypothetical protein
LICGASKLHSKETCPWLVVLPPFAEINILILKMLGNMYYWPSTPCLMTKSTVV